MDLVIVTPLILMQLLPPKCPTGNTYYKNAHGLISGSGEDVGLPDGQMGNSEVGHMNLGAGRVVYQDFTRITKAIREGDFFTNPVITDAVDKAVARIKRCIFGAYYRKVVCIRTKTIYTRW
jgi:bisphosphoglycerate-independent phosphoglycerate mutase (AlkP superfamily)